MTHSTSDLLDIVHHFYPGARWPDEPGYSETEEDRRLMAEVHRAGTGADHERWLSMLGRLETRFPGRIANTALHLMAAHRSAAYEGVLSLVNTEDEKHNLCFSVSFLVPYYVVYSWRWTPSSGFEVRFDLNEAERPNALRIAGEIEATYGYEPMLPEVGSVVVEDVEIAGVRYHYVKEGRIYDYLLSVWR